MIRTALCVAFLVRCFSAEVDSCYSLTVSLLQAKLDVGTGRSTAGFLPDHAKVVQYVKSAHDQGDVDDCHSGGLAYAAALNPNANAASPTWSRDVQRCIGTSHKLMVKKMLNPSLPEATDFEVLNQRHVIDTEVNAFEEAYPPKNVTDSIASYACVHFVDLENMIRRETSASPESFDPQNIAQNWKPIADDIFRTWVVLYGDDALKDPFQALGVIAGTHVKMVEDSFAASGLAVHMSSMK